LPTVSFFGESFRRQDEPDGDDEAHGENGAEEIVAALRELGPLAAKPLAKLLGRSEGAVRRSLAALVDDGRVMSEKVGRSLRYGASEGRK
jgi:predicted ArsR family transcriptional regulator